MFILSQVVLAGTKSKAVTAVKDLIYSGTCNLNEVALAFQNLFSSAVAAKIIYPQLNLPEILETLAVLGIEVSGKSFGFPTKSTDDVERTASNHPSSECQGFGGVEEGHRASSDVFEKVKKGLGGTEAEEAMTETLSQYF